jgi:hypothetical protein
MTRALSLHFKVVWTFLDKAVGALDHDSPRASLRRNHMGRGKCGQR